MAALDRQLARGATSDAEFAADAALIAAAERIIVAHARHGHDLALPTDDDGSAPLRMRPAREILNELHATRDAAADAIAATSKEDMS